MVMKRCVWLLPIVFFLLMAGQAAAEFGNEFKLLAPDGQSTDFFGNSVAISGDTMIVGAESDATSSLNGGSAYIFVYDTGTMSWVGQQKLVAPYPYSNGYYGSAVAIEGDIALVGAMGDGDQYASTPPLFSGAVYVYERSGETWTMVQRLAASDAAERDGLGTAIAFSNNTLVVGANNLNKDRIGAAYIFTRDSSTGIWSEEQKLQPSDGVIGDGFGLSVAIDGDTVIVGSSTADVGDTDTGAAYVFTRSSGVWTEQQKLIAQDITATDYFGSAMSILGDMAIVGAYRAEDSGFISGAAYVFNRSGSTWTESQKLVPSDGTDYTAFGYGTLAISADTLVVGAYSRDTPTTTHGSAYIFSLDSGTGDWTEQQKLTASDGEDGDSFGWSVSLDGGRLVVGAYGDDDNGSSAGAAYVYSQVSACAGLVENCDFEIEVPSNGTGGGWTSYNIGPFASDGWVTDNCQDGSCFALNASGDFNTDPTIEQSVNGLTAGATYSLTGDYAIYHFGWVCPNGGGGPLAVDVDGSLHAEFNNPGCDQSAITWGSFETSFVAQASDVTIAFRAEVDSDTDYAIDNIALVEVQGPDITVSPTSYDFGSVTVGTSSDQEITVTNDGSADLTLGDAAVADPIESPFEILATSSCLADGILSPAESCSYTVRFAPDFIGTADSTFDITSDDLDEESITITLAGEGVAAAAPDISISPITYNFGSVTVGASDTHDITVTNDGDALLTLGTVADVNPIEAPFEIQAGSSCLLDGELSPTESCVYSVSFSPVAVGSASADFDIVSDDPDEASQIISLSGAGIAAPAPNIDITPAAIDFPDTTVGVVLGAETVTIGNTGTADLAISAIELAGLDAAQFNLDASSGVSPCGGSITLAPAEDCTVELTFEPDEAGAAAATLDVSSDDPDTPVSSVALTGTALDPSANNPPSKPELISPANGQTFNLGTFGDRRIFRWHPATDPDGDEVSYDLYLCTDSDPLAACYYGTVASYSTISAVDTSYASFVPLDVNDQDRNKGATAVLVIMLLLAAGLAWKTRKMMAMWALLILTGFIITSCGDSKGGIKFIVEDLQPGTTYYWAVVAKDDNGGETASDVWSFTTR